MARETMPRQSQAHQPGRETEMSPRPEYEPRTPLIPASFDAEHVARHGANLPMGRPGEAERGRTLPPVPGVQ
jgi:hypothetical protein